MTSPTRRQWLQNSALAATGYGLAGCGGKASADRLRLGVIGCGQMGRQNVQSFLKDERILVSAFADPNEQSNGYWHDEIHGRVPLQNLVEDYYGKVWNKPGDGAVKTAAYSDFREMLDKEDLDAVLVATPDHWHSIPSIAALEQDLHVYCQKPLALTIAEGRAIADAAAGAKGVFQVGTQQRSDAHIRKGVEIVRNGFLGKLSRVVVGIRGGNPNYSRRGKETDPVDPPKGFDWDLWLGPAPEAPYCPARAHANWRWLYEYSGGNMTDWGAHHIDIAQWGLGKDHTGPVRIFNIEGELPKESSFYNTAITYRFECEYEDGSIIEVSEKEKYGTRGGVVFHGEDDQWIHVDRGEIETSPGSLKRSRIPADGDHLIESRQHEESFITAALAGSPTVAPAEAGHRTATICHLANIAIRLGRSELKWDPVAEVVLDDPEAQAMIAREMRAPWSL